jgi:hypothetical protein
LNHHRPQHDYDVWLTVLILAAFLVFLMLLPGCGRKDDEPGNVKPAYHSHLTEGEAITVASKIASEVHGTVGNTAYTGSMHPILGGNCYTIKVHEYDRVEVGMLVVARYGEKHILHRVVDITPHGFRVKGYANKSLDPFYVTRQTYRGTVIGWVFHREEGGL